MFFAQSSKYTLCIILFYLLMRICWHVSERQLLDIYSRYCIRNTVTAGSRHMSEETIVQENSLT